jgi:hypothetical protein
MVVAFLPVPTAALGSRLPSAENRLAAVLFFSGTLAILGVFHNVLWWYAAYWGRVTAPEFPADKRRQHGVEAARASRHPGAVSNMPRKVGLSAGARRCERASRRQEPDQ